MEGGVTTIKLHFKYYLKDHFKYYYYYYYNDTVADQKGELLLSTRVRLTMSRSLSLYGAKPKLGVLDVHVTVLLESVSFMLPSLPSVKVYGPFPINSFK